MASHPLDNPVWGALTGRHAPLAIASGRFLRYRSDVGVFVGAEDPGEGYNDLANAVPIGTVVAIVSAMDVAVPPGFEAIEAITAPQMIAPPLLRSSTVPMRPLGDADVPAMLELTALTHPGPFLPRTIEMGSYRGVFDGDRLVAMAGERMQPPGFTEISAVCTHPDYQGRGYAKALMAAIAELSAARGDTPFLHVRADNPGAIALYRSLGFTVRHEMSILALRRAA